MEKENLILVHSFPTNSILLQGYTDYLSDHYQVYFVDLPGFTKAVSPLDQVTIAGFCRYVEKKIEEFNLDTYFAEGISFGFAIVNQIDHHGKCKGIIAVEPFLGLASLRMPTRRRIFFSFALQAICWLKAYALFWENPLLSALVQISGRYPPATMQVICEQMDGRTFFETANLILNDRTHYLFHDLPYVLLANKQDRTINFDYIDRALSHNVKNLLIIHVEIDHFPRDISKAYFQKMVPEQVFQQIATFFSANTRSSGKDSKTQACLTNCQKNSQRASSLF